MHAGNCNYMDDLTCKCCQLREHVLKHRHLTLFTLEKILSLSLGVKCAAAKQSWTKVEDNI